MLIATGLICQSLMGKPDRVCDMAADIISCRIMSNSTTLTRPIVCVASCMFPAILPAATNLKSGLICRFPFSRPRAHPPSGIPTFSMCPHLFLPFESQFVLDSRVHALAHKCTDQFCLALAALESDRDIRAPCCLRRPRPGLLLSLLDGLLQCAGSMAAGHAKQARGRRRGANIG